MERYETGIEMLKKVDGIHGEEVIRNLEGISPALSRFIVEFAFGDIYSRKALSLRDRQLVTISSLATQGCCSPQLEVHIKASLNVGLTPRKIMEALLHCAPYTGFPKTINAVLVAHKVFQERNVQPDWTEGNTDSE